MKNAIAIIAFALLGIGGVSAQVYQGEANFGYMASIGEDAGRIPLHVVNGVRFNDRTFAGIGVGVNFHHRIKGVEIPIYLNGKYYFKTYGKAAPFLSLDLGGYVGTGAVSYLSGFTTTPAVGVAIAQGDKTAIHFTVGYNYQSIKRGGGVRIAAYDAIVLKLGCAF